MSQFDYDKLVDQGFLMVVREILLKVQKDGLKEPNHFYITFLTHYQGVDIPSYLKKEYPKEMTIVLQYEFWDLRVDVESFSVGLRFNDKEEKITIPFKSLSQFSDPSQDFVWDFMAEDLLEEEILEQQPAGTVISLDQFRKKPS